MKTNETKIAELEDLLKRQSRVIENLFKRIKYLERENSRRRTDVEKLENAVRRI
jgi:hypothetical protein